MLKIAKPYLLQHCPTMTLRWMILFNLVLRRMPNTVLQNNRRKVSISALAGEKAIQVYLLI